ncbi:MAG: ABC transporter permease [Candidatus Lokiarchaeota archaeon]|nr:ABC transporter permease [Candidatus Lokiarchaeota archaeon]
MVDKDISKWKIKIGPILGLIGSVLLLIAGFRGFGVQSDIEDILAASALSWASIGFNPWILMTRTILTILFGAIGLIGTILLFNGKKLGAYLLLIVGSFAVLGMFIPIGTIIFLSTSIPVSLSYSFLLVEPFLILIGGILALVFKAYRGRISTMLNYIIKRVLVMIPTIFLVLLVTFILSTLMSQNINLNKLGGGLVPPELVELEKQRIGFYDPWFIKVAKYFTNFFSGNWGTSYIVLPDEPVIDLIVKIFPKTIELVIIPIILIPILSVKLGVISAKNRNNWKDTVVRSFMMIGVCIPVFWLATLLQYFFSVVLESFTYGAINLAIGNTNSVNVAGTYVPITGFRLIDAFLTNDQYLLQDSLMHMYLPAFCLVIVSLAGITRQTRASMLEVIQKDYVRTARAKGVPDKDVMNKHTLRNALIPASTTIVGTVAGLLTGSLFIEMSFNYTGMGFYMVQSILRGDYVVVSGMLVYTSIIILIGIIVADVLYTIIDPRIVYT